jgi:hypothetical protein
MRKASLRRVKRAFDGAQMRVEGAAQIGQAGVVGGGEAVAKDHVRTVGGMPTMQHKRHCGAADGRHHPSESSA